MTTQRVKSKYYISTNYSTYSFEHEEGFIHVQHDDHNPVGYTMKDNLSIEEAKFVVQALSLAIKDAEEKK